jgi:flagellar biosynthesis protein
MARAPHSALKVVALSYQAREDRAPKIAAKGRGYMAERLIEIAKAHHVPIREDKNLVELLSHLDLNQEIPPEVYKAVAQILAFVYRIAQRSQSALQPL